MDHARENQSRSGSVPVFGFGALGLTNHEILSARIRRLRRALRRVQEANRREIIIL